MPHDLSITGDEADLLLRALEAYIDGTNPRDRSTAHWLSERILRGFPGLRPHPTTEWQPG